MVLNGRVKTVLAVSGLVFALSLGAPAKALADGDDTFVPNTCINGISVSGLTVEQASRKLQDPAAYQFEILKRDGSKEVIRGNEIGYQVVLSGELSSILTKQNDAGRQQGPGAPQQFTAAVTVSYDAAALDARIQSLSVMQNEGVTITQDARISSYEAGQPFRIIPEVQGDDVNREHTAAVIQAAVAAGQTQVDLAAQGCYRIPQVTQKDPALLELLSTMNRIGNMQITYDFLEKTAEDGSVVRITETLDGDVMKGWVIGAENGEIQVDRDAAATWVKDLALCHNTSYTARKFCTVSGREVELTGPYGWSIDQKAETDALIGMIRTGQSQTRQPEYATRAVSRTAPEWGSTYVEIDLTGQHVYMVQEGQVVWDAPCVTGNVSKDYTTPQGIYSLAYKQKDKVLRGKKLPDGKYEYESPVNFWMPFNGGIGLHDANWRSSFGGEIYKTNGSHGCVNLPPASVPALYDLVYTGIPIICYN